MAREFTTTPLTELDPFMRQVLAEQDAPERAKSPELESILFRMKALEPGDHEILAQILRDHPALREDILAQATRDLGNHTVRRALALLDTGATDGQSSSLRGRERDVVDFDSAHSSDPYLDTSSDRVDLDVAVRHKEPGWAVRARAYHDRHSAEVAQFNRHTRMSCMSGEELDPAKVAAWQARHNVAPDGRVGPATIAAARLLEPDFESAGR